MNSLIQHALKTEPTAPAHTEASVPPVRQITGIGRKFKQISAAKLSNIQWFVLLYVAGFGSLLLLVTLLKIAMKLI